MRFLLIFAAILLLADLACSKNFTIDYANNCFSKDGKPFRYISSSLHYFRIPRPYWVDRMNKLRLLGVDTIQTYLEWSQHEAEEGKYNFEYQLNIIDYVKLAQQMGFFVILRPGPYIDAERDFGGLPYWLLKNKSLKVRSHDPSYMIPVEKWLNKVLPMLKPLLYKNGGPITLVQVENEYGSYFTHDRPYTEKLRDIIAKNFDNDVLLFSVDGDSTGYLKFGTIPNVYATVDFGPGSNVNSAFKAQRAYEPHGPSVNAEYYPGWLDHWGHPHAQVSSKSVASTLDQILQYNASVNIYMGHGGTSFGFTSGSNGDEYNFQPCPTSYDYDAPISEAGDLTPKFLAIRNVIKKYKIVPDEILPLPSPKMSLGPLQMKRVISLFDAMDNFTEVSSILPLTFEELDQAHGYVRYSTTINKQFADPATLSIPGMRDRGYVFVDRIFQGILSRGEKVLSLPITAVNGQTLTIVVENQGRICFGRGLQDSKGIISQVYLDNVVLLNWKMTKLPLSDIKWLNEIPEKCSVNGLEDSTQIPAFYASLFQLPESMSNYPEDTFLRVDGWHKGVAFLNGFNLGRYWPIMGPQITLYVPKHLFNPYPLPNKLVLLEFEHAPCQVVMNCTVNFVKNPQINGPTPNKS